MSMMWSMSRGAAIGVLALASAWVVVGAAARMSARWRGRFWLALWTGYITPTLLAGYAYADLATVSLIRWDWGRELLYSLLMWVRMTPLAAMVVALAPRVVSPSGEHAWRMRRGLRGGGAGDRLGDAAFWLRTHGAACVGAWGLVWLMSIAEFEMASLMQVNSWSFDLFREFSGGLELGEAIARARWELVLGAAAAAGMTLGLASAIRTRQTVRGERDDAPPAHDHGAGRIALAWAWAALGVMLMLAYPLWVVGIDVARGLGAGRMVIGRDIAFSLWTSALAALAATAAGRLAARHLRGAAGGVGGVTRAALVWACMLIAMGGTVPLAFAVLWLFRARPLSWLYGTPWMLIAGMAIWLLPWSVLLGLVFGTAGDSARHAARLLAGSPDAGVRRSSWWTRARLASRGAWWSWVLLWFGGYMDVGLAAVLAPPGATPVAVTLYNQMHYSRSSALSLLVMCSILPALAVVAVGALSKGRFSAVRAG